MNKRKCPDCKSTEIIYRCEICGCQWAKTSKIPEENRVPDPRLLKAIEEIESILQLKADSAIQGEFTDGFDSGLRRAVYLVKKCIPEVKDG